MEVETSFPPSSFPVAHKLLDKRMVLVDDTSLNTEVMNSMVVSNEEREEIEESSETLTSRNTDMVDSMVVTEKEETEFFSETLVTKKSTVINIQEESGEGSENFVEAVELRSATEIDGSGGETKAVLKMQKAYRGYRTRRKLADSAVLAEEYWWQAIDFARLNHSTISFFNMPETPISRWNRVAMNASIMTTVGKGELMDTSIGSEGAKWIFVMSTSKKLYAGEKKKGCFHHSTFLAGGTTLAAGRLVAENGELKTISAYSGHYRPTEENLDSFKDFLSENGADLNKVQIRSSTDDHKSNGDSNSVHGSGPLEAFANKTEASASSDSLHLEIPNGEVEDQILSEPTEGSLGIERKASHKRTLSGGLQSPRADVPKIKILQRINSKNATSSYQLGHQLSRKWSTGAGPRIGCVADYPPEIQQQALEFVNLSPRAPLETSQHYTELFPSSPRSKNGSAGNCTVDN
ncbi:IQ domain-containing protein IQM3-like [Papaver somniferum]|uniref:IQ domain-containing protein IQM3-like n=1 Tax=Papaver somniferum TaxID=3469 RepID=UPI000E6FE82F|nr:IQ domain-containing protein IQM3-like [Papaver somniferum]